jgi:hypothetical protein
MKHKLRGDGDYSLAEISALVKEYRASGLGVPDFARQHRLAPGRLHYWIYQKCRSRPAPPARPAGGPPRFQEVKLAALWPGAETWAAEVSLVNGLQIRFRPEVSPGWVGSVVHALQRPC